MILKCYSTAGISITQDVLRGGCPGGFTSFVLREKLKNNAVNEGKIGR